MMGGKSSAGTSGRPPGEVPIADTLDELEGLGVSDWSTFDWKKQTDRGSVARTEAIIRSQNPPAQLGAAIRSAASTANPAENLQRIRDTFSQEMALRQRWQNQVARDREVGGYRRAISAIDILKGAL